MKTLKHFIVTAGLYFAIQTLGMGHQFYVTLFGRDDSDGSIGIHAFDGNEFIAGVRSDSGHNEEAGDPDQNGEYGPPIISDEWTVYLVTVPDSWLIERRGVSFHVPGRGLTSFFPMQVPIDNQVPNYDLNYWGWPNRAYPNPDVNTTTSGNRVLLGRWWSNPGASVARLNTWDNDSPYWRCAGVDFISSTQHTFWRWMHQDASQLGTQLAMDLDYMHRLTLHGRATSNTITIDPDAGSIKINNLPLVTAANAETQLSSALSSAFVSRSSGGVNLAQSGGTLRSQPGFPPQLLLGAQNDIRTADNGTDHTQGVLIVGSTADPGTNGLRILDDGTVLIRPRGGLQMATEFSKGPQP